MELDFVINHIRNRGYMDGVERTKERVRSTGEVFTPYELVLEYIDYCESQYPDAFIDPTNNFCDNSVGDGQFLGEVLIRKMEHGIDFETALASIYGVDFEKTNVELCRERLLCGSTDPRHLEITKTNIVCADALRYTYKFSGPGEQLYEDDEAKQQEFEGRLNSLFDFG